MPEIAYTTELRLPLDEVWTFVSDMNNWAPFLTGYQRHQVVDETDSIWTLKGDVGILSRVVELRAHVTEWSAPERVAFTLTGLNETVDGGGSLVIAEGAPGVALPAPPAPGLFQRLLRWLFRLVNRGASDERRALPAATGRATKLTFTLRMEAGGPTGPLVNAMLGPAMEPAVEDLANKIASHLEGRA